MGRLIDEITVFLEKEGFVCSRQMRDGFDVICTLTLDGKSMRVILPLGISAETPEEARMYSEAAYDCMRFIQCCDGRPLIITEDRWHSQKKMMQSRLLAHLELFSPAYARNCEVRRIEKDEARKFLNENHSYGYAACRYCYGLFLKRHTGYLAAESTIRPETAEDVGTGMRIGDLIAVATFSNARRWMKGEQEISSYEWTRYASLPQARVNGGMGKILKTFIRDVHPDDIMSYADLEWSDGKVYGQLGFVLEGQKDPVMFTVDLKTWKRVPVRPGTGGMTGDLGITGSPEHLFFRNFGSNKYRLKLTEYE